MATENYSGLDLERLLAPEPAAARRLEAAARVLGLVFAVYMLGTLAYEVWIGDGWNVLGALLFSPLVIGGTLLLTVGAWGVAAAWRKLHRS